MEHNTKPQLEYLNTDCKICGDEEQGYCRENANCLNVPLLKKEPQICYKSNKPCPYDCSGLCKDSY